MRSHGNGDTHLPERCERLQKSIENRRVDAPRTDTWLTDEDRAHLSECSECAGFLSLLQIMSTKRFVVDEHERHQVIDRVNELYFARHKRSRLLLKAAGVVAGVAAALLAVFWFFRPDMNPAIPTPSKSAPELALTTGSVSEFWHGAARLFLKEGGRAAVVEESVSSLAIRVNNGLLAVIVDPDRKETTKVRVMAGNVQVKVTGTVFAVERHRDQVRVDVLRGSVECRTDGETAEPIMVTAGQSLSTATGEQVQLDRERIEEIREYLDLHETSPTAPSDTSIRHPRAPVKKPSKASLLTEARRCRIQKEWRCAERHYKQLQHYYPNSVEAVTSLISLAQLRLNKLGMPQKALVHFRAYLKAMPSGPLAEEAVFGIALAYKKLGRREQERKALQTFVEKYPKSHLYSEANKRLEALSQ
jgi:ferric-dicitrate binding protein FerR (iron transport regulator)